MDFFNYGRCPKFIPRHNMYMPVQHTIMPRPKFRDYNKEDETGKDFTYRTKDRHTPASTELPSTLKPHPFSPFPKRNEDTYN